MARGLRLGIATEEEVVKLLSAGDITQREIADKMGIHQSSVSAIALRRGFRRSWRVDSPKKDKIERVLSDDDKREIIRRFHVCDEAVASIAFSFRISRKRISQITGPRQFKAKIKKVEASVLVVKP